MYLIIILLFYEIEFPGPQSTKVTLKAGRYQVYCHGAQGGRGHRQGKPYSYGGKGAYTTGVMQITGSGTDFYLNIGGMGGYESVIGPNSGGYNGGGKSGVDIPDENGNMDAPGGGDDASGGGGGATDIRIYDNKLSSRIMVAAGGSGAAFRCDGAPGGDYKGYCPLSDDCDVYLQSDDVTETKGNEDGVGSNGADFHCTPGSGGGGGYRGGISNKYLYCNDSHLAVSVSGSSYISGHPGFKKNSLFAFNETIMYYGNHEDFGKEGNGSLRIKAIYECPSDCSDCSSGDYCIDCFSYSYKYNNLCYLSCDSLNRPNENKYFGNDDVNKICMECKVDWCKDCALNYSVCKECIDGFHLENGYCIHNPTLEFTNSKHFSKSVDFSNSNVFSFSSQFSHSSDFSLSSKFSHSKEFTFSFHFTSSDVFTSTHLFSLSSQFSSSQYFSHSLAFSESKMFSNSNEFSKSKMFSGSSEFSESKAFTDSSKFSESQMFSDSNEFSESKVFSDSSEFSESQMFSNSNEFSKSKMFSDSNEFSVSKVFPDSNMFQKSNIFSDSNKFSEPKAFSNSYEFSESQKFSVSNEFSKSTVFSASNPFSESQLFFDLNEFSASKTFSELNKITTLFRHRTTLSISFSLSYTRKRSVSFSISYLSSYSYFMTNINGQMTYMQSASVFPYYLPYIIVFYSQSFVQTIVVIELYNRRKISTAMLIGICCGSTSIVLFIIAVIIIAYKKHHELKSNDYSISSDEVEFLSRLDDKNAETDNQSQNLKSDSDSDLDFWL